MTLGTRRRFHSLLFALLLGVTPAHATIQYAVSTAHPELHLFRVTMIIPNVKNEVAVQLPAWNALYQIRDFAYHLQGVRATDGRGQPLAIRKVDKQTWQVTGNGTVVLRYAAHWDEPGPFSSQLNSEHAFVNLATILFFVPERRGEDTRVGFYDLPQGWRVAVALKPWPAVAATSAAPEPMAMRQVPDQAEATRPAFVITAASYDTLVDAPVEMGTFEEFQLEGTRPPVRVAIHGDGWSREQVAAPLRRIVGYQTQLMGGAPYDEYLFIFHIGKTANGSGGGMEHADSTAIWVGSPADLPAVSAHEFFHLWNVKRVRPQSLEPVDYTREQWTRALWFAEGVTNTYGAYTLVRTGLWSSRQFYHDLANQIAELESRPARNWKSVEEASLDAWLEKYALYRGPDFSISYYNKGQLLGVLLDIVLRDSTENRVSLDDLLRELNNDFARQGRFYHDTADIRATAERLSQRSLEDFFSRYVGGTDELPYADLLARAGLQLRVLSRERADLGFWPGRGPNGSIAVTRIDPSSSAARAGLRDGDLLVAVDGARVPRDLSRWLGERHPGETVRLRVRRDAEEKEIAFALGARHEKAYVVEEAVHPSEKQRRILEGLLHGTTNRP